MKIFCTLLYEINLKQNIAVAISEDGYLLVSEIAPDAVKAQYEVGMTSKKNHAAYKEHYPNGFELEWLNEPGKHRLFLKAMKKAHERKKATQ